MTGKRHWMVWAAAAVVLGGVCAGAVAQEKLTIEGSTTVGPIADAFAEAFMADNPDLGITVKKTGSGDGAAALVDDRCDIATLSRFMKASEFKKAVENGVMPVAHVVAMDGVCVIVNPVNSVSALTTGQVRKIYQGEITNWNELGGPDMEIVAVSRDSASGTYETFHKLVMEGTDMGDGVEYATSNPDVHKRVKTTRGAVGYVGLGFVDRDVRAMKVDDVMPTRKTIASGKYPVARPLFLFTNGYPKLGSIVHAFVTYHLTEAGQDIVEAKGFVPVTNY